jgi:catechol 2,3-dioxygenase-like lactoylglutathione lyase family enzyme
MATVEESCPFAVVTIDHVVIRAHDLQKMLAFYTKVLGCQVERELVDLGLQQLRAGSSLIDLVDVTGPLGGDANQTGRNMDHFCIQILPWDAALILQHLKHHGIATGDVERRYGALGTGPSIYIEDPEGNVVELKGPPD